MKKSLKLTALLAVGAAAIVAVTSCGGGHTHTEVVDAAKAATCTEAGLTEGKHCSECGEVLVEQQVVPAKGHTEVVDPAKAATCGAEGLTEGKHCDECNAIIVEQTVVAKIDHTYSAEWASTPVSHYHEATCGHDAKKDEGEHDKLGTPKNHEDVPATYESQGQDWVACSVCGAEWSIPIPKLEKESPNYTVPVSKIYDGKAVTISKAAGTLVTELDESLFTINWYESGSTTKLAQAPVNAGTYDLEIVVAESATTSASTVKMTYTIKQAMISYKTKLSYTYNGLAYNTFTSEMFDGVAEGDSISVKATFNSANAGASLEKLELLNEGAYANYKLDATVSNYQASIEKATLEIKNNINITYDGKTTTKLPAKNDFNNIASVDADGLKLVVTRDGKDIDADITYITLMINDEITENYILPENIVSYIDVVQYTIDLNVTVSKSEDLTGDITEVDSDDVGYVITFDKTTHEASIKFTGADQSNYAFGDVKITHEEHDILGDASGNETDTASTFTEQGKTWHTCSICGLDTYEEKELLFSMTVDSAQIITGRGIAIKGSSYSGTISSGDVVCYASNGNYISPVVSAVSQTADSIEILLRGTEGMTLSDFTTGLKVYLKHEHTGNVTAGYAATYDYDGYSDSFDCDLCGGLEKVVYRRLSPITAESYSVQGTTQLTFSNVTTNVDFNGQYLELGCYNKTTGALEKTIPLTFVKAVIGSDSITDAAVYYEAGITMSSLIFKASTSLASDVYTYDFVLHTNSYNHVETENIKYNGHDYSSTTGTGNYHFQCDSNKPFVYQVHLDSGMAFTVNSWNIYSTNSEITTDDATFVLYKKVATSVTGCYTLEKLSDLAIEGEDPDGKYTYISAYEVDTVTSGHFGPADIVLVVTPKESANGKYAAFHFEIND